VPLGEFPIGGLQRVVIELPLRDISRGADLAVILIEQRRAHGDVIATRNANGGQ